jgi:hypothetical protein
MILSPITVRLQAHYASIGWEVAVRLDFALMVPNDSHSRLTPSYLTAR